jgi:hypothetical protein
VRRNSPAHPEPTILGAWHGRTDELEPALESVELTLSGSALTIHLDDGQTISLDHSELIQRAEELRHVA